MKTGTAEGAGEGSAVRILGSAQGEQRERCWNGRVLQMFAQLSGTSAPLLFAASDTNKASGVCRRGRSWTGHCAPDDKSDRFDSGSERALNELILCPLACSLPERCRASQSFF